MISFFLMTVLSVEARYERFYPSDLNQDGTVNLEDVAYLSRDFGKTQDVFVIRLIPEDPCDPVRTLYYEDLNKLFPPTALLILNTEKCKRLELSRAVKLEN